MLDNLRAWLNGTREYNLGVSLYKELSTDDALYKVFLQGKTDYTNKRLQNELMAICLKLKAEKNGSTLPSKTSEENQKNKRDSNTKGTVPTSQNKPSQKATQDILIPNPELYQSCKNEADKAYKECMNKRAVLFSLIPDKNYEDPNRPDLVKQRSKLAVDVVVMYNKASKLYDRADYVKIHGHLPGTEKEEEDTSEYDALPDHMVKQTLDNLRKNYNKIKNREQTPDRIALQQKHEANIKKLENRWHLLNSKT